eukprot:6840384-Prymnesium_polylepis.1
MRLVLENLRDMETDGSWKDVASFQLALDVDDQVTFESFADGEPGTYIALESRNKQTEDW